MCRRAFRCSVPTPYSVYELWLHRVVAISASKFTVEVSLVCPKCLRSSWYGVGQLILKRINASFVLRSFPQLVQVVPSLRHFVACVSLLVLEVVPAAVSSSCGPWVVSQSVRISGCCLLRLCQTVSGSSVNLNVHAIAFFCGWMQCRLLFRYHFIQRDYRVCLSFNIFVRMSSLACSTCVCRGSYVSYIVAM